METTHFYCIYSFLLNTIFINPLVAWSGLEIWEAEQSLWRWAAWPDSTAEGVGFRYRKKYRDEWDLAWLLSSTAPPAPLFLFALCFQFRAWNAFKCLIHFLPPSSQDR